MKRRYYIAALVMLSLLSLAIVGVRAAQAAEEPTPGVGRVSLIHGDVSTMRGDSGDWVATTVNAPIVGGDKISTGDRSQTEVQLDYANVMRLAPQGEAKVADLSRTNIQVQVAQGLLFLTVFKGSEAEVEIDTPNVAVRPLREGSYRVEVNPGGETRVIVREGEAEIATPQGSTKVGKNKLITIQGTDDAQYQIANAPKRDDWDNWNRERDSSIRDAQSYRYTNRYYTGTQDLDRNGRWDYVPGYDWCWTPYINNGWVPYRDGRWVWEPYWGWTWVSYEPWGWAPYHYGRWFLHSNSWYWWPGYRNYGYYPTWAPAYVSFIGFGFGGRNWNFGFGFGFGSIGWLPLGPYDHYYPWHGRHNRYDVVNITNITNVTNITNINGGGRVRNSGNRPYMSNVQTALSNPRMRQAITSVSSEDFVRGRVPRNPRSVDEQSLRQAQVVRGTLPAVPTRESLRPTDKVVNPTTARSGGARAENFFTRRQPPAGPQSFTERQAEIRQMVQKENPLAAANSGAAGARANAAQNSAGGTSARSGGRPAQAQQGQVRSPAAGPANTSAQRGGENALSNRQRTTLTQQAGTANPAPEATAANRPETSQRGQPVVAPTSTADRPGWQRFGGGSRANQLARAGVPGAAPAGRAVPQESSTAPAKNNENRQAQPARQPERPSNWQRFGTGSSRPAPGRGATSAQPSQAQPAPRSGATTGSRSGINVQGGKVESRPAAPKAAQPSSQAAPQAAPSRSNWRQFSSAPSEGTATPSRSAPRSNGQAVAPSRTAPSRPAPTSRGNDGSSWRRFEGQSRPAPSARGGESSAPPGQTRGGDRPSWGNAPSRTESPSYGRAPRSSERPPLEIRKPIVTERAAPSRQYGGGGSYGSRTGGRSSSPPPRSMGRSSSPPRSSGGSVSRPSGSSSRGSSRSSSRPSNERGRR